MRHHFRVTKLEDQMKLLDFVATKLSASKKQIKRFIETNHCLINNKMERFANTQVNVGDVVEFHEVVASKPTFQPKHILFEDAYLLIYNKPSGVTTDQKGIVELLKPHGSFFLTHRLDKDTSGAVILAKSKEIEEKLAEAFLNRLVKKEYLALVDGIPKAKEGLIENTLGKIGGFEGQTLYGKVNQGGKHAKTTWKLGKYFKKEALLHCYPETGRTHQIRVHLSEIGHPILGDYQYGKAFKSSLRPSRQMLHAYRLSFLHPVTEEPIKVQAPIPKDFQEMMT